MLPLVAAQMIAASGGELEGPEMSGQGPVLGGMPSLWVLPDL